MNAELKELIASDLKRIYELPLSLKELFYLPPQLKYLRLWRKASYYRGRSSFLAKLYAFRLERLSYRTLIQLPPEVTAGPGLYIGHFGRLILHPDTVLGKNVNLATGVTIGRANRSKHEGVPVIGDEVWIGTNAVVVGGIHIGSDVLIAPGAYVNTDVPDHSIVIGNPAVIHPSPEATKGYINRKV